ncbi:arginine ABC transporter, periplasmic arginine-binding protein ArtP family protein [Aedoeadaptatus coxii]|uniref:transporter substrate-binding domain-containing protein n=1 Tax=Aedoeadaptatus coxii TaxID=755172 RepID=UPI00175B96BF|nr:transporter substrate-binding domain-containing protein [Peptoniphilus coxii]CAC9933579.1 arginine ABC transporter, periplasmic arginine-binding protein ArtP family protein [Peptoniphilus coxii]
MKHYFKKFSYVLLMVATLMLLASCGKAETNNAKKENANSNKPEATASADKKYGLDISEITIATSPGYKPFEYMEDGKLVGYDIDIWNEFEKRTGIKVNWEQADFSGLLGLLDTDRAQVVAAQMGPTPEREQRYAFSEPISYFKSVLIVKEDEKDIKTAEDLAGKTIGVGAGNNMKADIDKMYPNGDVKWEIFNSATLDGMLKEVANGKLDGCLAQDIQGLTAIKETGLPLKVTPAFKSEPGTLVVKKDNKELLDAINAFIADIQADGTLKQISEKWIGMDITKAE